jgi:peptidoglycan/LPS O-acetylase OafA/YrhL
MRAGAKPKQSQAMSEEHRRIPSLDGLRAISIGLVLVGHLSGTQNFPISERVGGIFALGELGVRVFFVISGFLITGLLLQELRGKQHINLPKFYFRRTFRIFPAYYFFILALLFLEAARLIALHPGDIWHALTYTSNYHASRSWNVGHTWSLGVEEQFYLLWPAVLLIAGARRGLWAAASLLVLCPLIRLGLWHFFPESQSGIGHRFETIADALAVGCVLAGARHWLHRRIAYRKMLASKLFLVVPVAVFCANLLHDRPRLHFLFGYTVMNVGVALCIDWCVTNYSGRIGRFLNLRPLVFLGVMSYSIYLWQQLFLNRYSDSVFCRFPYNLTLVAVASLASYYLIEQPFLRLRPALEAKLFRRDKGKPLQEAVSSPVGLKTGNANPDLDFARQTKVTQPNGAAGYTLLPASLDSEQ